jgi:CrcB protein
LAASGHHRQRARQLSARSVGRFEATGVRLKSALVNALLVGSGGFAGAIFRYALGGVVHRELPLQTFPYGTLCVNLLGCALIGALAGLADSRQLFAPELRAFAFIGLLGGFTTFSTFGFETIALARDGELLRAASNVALHVFVGLALCWLAYGLTGSR